MLIKTLYFKDVKDFGGRHRAARGHRDRQPAL